jgi:hypothetical protein
MGGSNNHTQFDGLDLGFITPYRPSKVSNLKNFRYEKTTGHIMKQKFRKVLVTCGNPLSIIIETPVMENVSDDPLSIASIGTPFTTTKKHNLRHLYHHNQEKDAIIKEL